jgi:hypothetical protein
MSSHHIDVGLALFLLAVLVSLTIGAIATLTRSPRRSRRFNPRRQSFRLPPDVR